MATATTIKKICIQPTTKTSHKQPQPTTLRSETIKLVSGQDASGCPDLLQKVCSSMLEEPWQSFSCLFHITRHFGGNAAKAFNRRELKVGQWGASGSSFKRLLPPFWSTFRTELPKPEKCIACCPCTPITPKWPGKPYKNSSNWISFILTSISENLNIQAQNMPLITNITAHWMVLRNESGDVSLKSEGQARTANWPNESRIPGFGIQNFSSEEFDEVEQSTSLKAPPHPSLKTNGSSQHTTAARSFFLVYKLLYHVFCSCVVWCCLRFCICLKPLSPTFTQNFNRMGIWLNQIIFPTRESHRWQGRDCWFALWLLCYVLCCLLILFAAFPWYCLRDASCGELTSMWSVSLSNNEEVPVQNDCGRTANMSMSLRKRRGGGRLSGFCFSSNIHASKKRCNQNLLSM